MDTAKERDFFSTRGKKEGKEKKKIRESMNKRLAGE